MPLEIGRVLGQYEIVALLGAGGMGEVYRAHDRKLGRDVALKVLTAGAGSHRPALARFRREIRAMSTLSHPAIVTVFDVGEVDGSDGTPFITMELIEGQSLRSWLSRPHERQLTVDLLTFVADGLASAHAKQVVHRDIKPENIMVLRDGYAKIVDFGLAKLAEGDGSPLGEADATHVMPTAKGQVVGTLAYMSPEQLEGREVDRRSDVFSFGCVLAEALSGKHPFSAPTRAAMLNRITTGRFDSLPTDGDDSTPMLNAVIARCLMPDREARYASMQDVAEDLKRFSRTSSEKATVMRPQQRPGRLRMMRLVAPPAVAAILVAGISLFLRQQPAVRAPLSAPRNPQLAEMFSRARFLEQDRSAAVKDRAIPLLETIVGREPSFVPAHVALAQAYSGKSFDRDADRAWEEKATLEIEKILALDPNNAAAYVTRGMLKWTAAHAFAHEEALAAFNRALSTDPNQMLALQNRGSVFMHIGLLDAALRDFSRVLKIDPNNDYVLYRVPRIHLYGGRYEEAITEYRRRFPRHFELPIALEHAGRGDEALDLAVRLVQEEPQNGDAWSTLALVAARHGLRERALEATRRTRELGEGSSHFHHAMYNMAVAYAQLGEPDEALHWLSRTADEGLPCTPLFERDPFLDPLRKLPRFEIFLRERRAVTERLKFFVRN